MLILHILRKNTNISGCKIVHLCIFVTVTVHICTITVACAFNILIILASISNSSFGGLDQCLVFRPTSLNLVAQASILLFDQWVRSCCSSRRCRSRYCLGCRSLLLRSSLSLTLSDLYRHPSAFLINGFLDL